MLVYSGVCKLFSYQKRGGGHNLVSFVISYSLSRFLWHRVQESKAIEQSKCMTGQKIRTREYSETKVTARALHIDSENLQPAQMFLHRNQMKGKGFRVFLSCVALLAGVVIPAMAQTVLQDFLNFKNSQLTTLVEQATENDARGCEHLASCSSEREVCSHEACKQSLEEAQQRSQGPFIYVVNNTFCPGQGNDNTCHFMSFDWLKSFVRLGPSTDTGSLATAWHLCAQRMLDPVFKSVSTVEDFHRVFFGSTTGIWRVFPGWDEAECRDFETRTRSWYIASTSVPKAVMVLIDIGASMSSKSGFGGVSFVETAKQAAWELLRTLAPGDFVNIVAFDSNNATEILFPLVSVPDRPNRKPGAPYPEFVELEAKLAQLKADQVHFAASNVTPAISRALENFDTIKRPDLLKVILVLTDGKFAEGSVTLPTESLVATKTKLFVYNVSPTAKPLSPSFTTQLRSIGGSFENIFRDVGNPLYAMESFFTFTANLHHRVMYPLADFTYKLDEFSRFNETILLVSKPAFRKDGTLLGVAGISIYRHMAKDNLDEIRSIVVQQQAGRQFDARTHVELDPANYTLQIEPKSIYVCGNTPLPENRGFCKQTNFSAGMGDWTCMHQTCRAPPEPSQIPVIVGSTVGAVGGLGLLIAVSCFLYRRGVIFADPVEEPVFPGSGRYRQNLEMN